MRINNGNVRLEANKKVSTKRIIAKNANGLSLQDDGGNYIKLNDGGIVDISSPSFVYAYINTDQTITTGTRTVLEFDYVDIDYHDEFDNTTNYCFTASKAGYYAVAAQGCISPLGDADHFIMAIYKNDSIQCDSRATTGGTTSIRWPVTKIIQLDENDYVTIKLYHGYGSDSTAIAGAANNHITIHKIA